MHSLQAIRNAVLDGKAHPHSGHKHDPFYGSKDPLPHVEGCNPLMDDYLRPSSTQAADKMPEQEGKRLMPMYLPVSANNIQGDGTPVESAKLWTRGKLMDDVVNEDYKNGSVGAIYRSYFMAWVCVGLTLLGLTISPYLAAPFAYMAGQYWSDKDLSVGWSIQWWKGKTITYTV